MRIAFVYFILFISVGAIAEDLNDLKRQLLFHSKVERSLKPCMKQIQQKKLPKDCYLILSLAPNLVINDMPHKNLMNHLNNLCERATKHIYQREVLEFYFNFPGVSSFCQLQLKNQYTKMKYIKNWQGYCCTDENG